MFYKEEKIILCLQVAFAKLGDFCLGWALFWLFSER